MAVGGLREGAMSCTVAMLGIPQHVQTLPWPSFEGVAA